MHFSDRTPDDRPRTGRPKERLPVPFPLTARGIAPGPVFSGQAGGCNPHATHIFPFGPSPWPGSLPDPLYWHFII